MTSGCSGWNSGTGLEHQCRRQQHAFLRPEFGQQPSPRHQTEFSHDLLAPFQRDITPATTTDPSREGFTVAPPPSHPLQLIVFSNFQYLDAEFTERDPDPPRRRRWWVTTSLRPISFGKAVSLSEGRCFQLRSPEFTSRINSGPTTTSQIRPPRPARPSGSGGCRPMPYSISAPKFIWRRTSACSGISNLSDEKYYSRVFLNGLIDPARGPVRQRVREF